MLISPISCKTAIKLTPGWETTNGGTPSFGGECKYSSQTATLCTKAVWNAPAVSRSRTTSIKSSVQKPGLTQTSLEKASPPTMPQVLFQPSHLLVVVAAEFLQSRPGARRKGRHMSLTSPSTLSKGNSNAGLIILLIIDRLSLLRISITTHITVNFIGGCVAQKRREILSASQHAMFSSASINVSMSSTMSGTQRKQKMNWINQSEK